MTTPLIDPRPEWNFSDAASSERRFRQLAGDATGAERTCWQTQVARALGLQGCFAEGLAMLDDLTDDSVESAVRIVLERGRLVRSGGDPSAARPLFDQAVGMANAAGLEELELDARHMVAIVAQAHEQVGLAEAAIARARAATDERARNWDASLLNNLGMTHADAERWDEALAAFREALVARERIGDPDTIRVATWMIAWTLRNQGHTAEALSMQRKLKAELDAAGASDEYVNDEIAILEARR